jgi:hypothetical protein
MATGIGWMASGYIYHTFPVQRPGVNGLEWQVDALPEMPKDLMLNVVSPK